MNEPMYPGSLMITANRGMVVRVSDAEWGWTTYGGNVLRYRWKDLQGVRHLTDEELDRIEERSLSCPSIPGRAGR